MGDKNRTEFIRKNWKLYLWLKIITCGWHECCICNPESSIPEVRIPGIPNCLISEENPEILICFKNKSKIRLRLICCLFLVPWGRLWVYIFCIFRNWEESIQHGNGSERTYFALAHSLWQINCDFSRHQHVQTLNFVMFGLNWYVFDKIFCNSSFTGSDGFIIDPSKSRPTCWPCLMSPTDSSITKKFVLIEKYLFIRVNFFFVSHQSPPPPTHVWTQQYRNDISSRVANRYTSIFDAGWPQILIQTRQVNIDWL